MNRRHFLLDAASCLPCCLLPGDFVRRATAALEAGDTAEALAAPTRAASTLYALDEGERYLLSLGSNATGPETLTWREWADYSNVNIDNREEFFDHAIEHGLLEETEKLDRLFSSPEDPIPSELQAAYIDWGWAHTDSPQAQAYHYLFGLSLGDSSSADGHCLGQLSFYEGAMPGSNWTWAETDSALVLASLQRRLLELGEDVKIEVQAC
jgi:hypothetical protein